LSVTEDALTPFGGLVPWAAYTRHIDIAEKLAADCPVKRTSPNAAPVYDIIQSFMLTALTDGRCFSHVERLREDPTIPELFGMESVVGDDTATATQWKETMEDAQRWLGERHVWFNRGDLGLGHDAVMRWHEQSDSRPKFLFKLKLTSGVRAALHRVPAEAWQGPNVLGAWQVAEGRLALHGWKEERRVVFSRQLQGMAPSEKAANFGTKTNTSSPCM
jgi:hypothetical protein